MKYTLKFFTLIGCIGLMSVSCSNDDDAMPVDPNPGVSFEIPQQYTFVRNGESTVDFNGQTTRILMAEEILDVFDDRQTTEEKLIAMFSNENSPFTNEDLNQATSKVLRSKVAASRDYFFENTVVSGQIKSEFDEYLASQANTVLTKEQEAAPGQAGEILDGQSTRLVNARGLEYKQLFNKGLIGALMLDQAINHYLSTDILDEASNREENTAATVAEGKVYTTMEHKWDEAYGYVYGTATSASDPNATIGADDSFLNKYIGRVEDDPSYSGIAKTIFEAFKTGRAAIVAQEYDVRDAQADILKKELSRIIAIRAVYYLQQGKSSVGDMAKAGTLFHDLSEGYGFIYSLQFTQNPDTGKPYVSRDEVVSYLTDLTDDGVNGLWDVEVATLDALSEKIATAFSISIEEAADASK